MRRVERSAVSGSIGLICLACAAVALAVDPPKASPPAPDPASMTSSDPHDFDGVWWTPGYDRKYRTVEGELPPFTERYLRS